MVGPAYLFLAPVKPEYSAGLMRSSVGGADFDKIEHTLW
jgi:hypothetical protein